ncbi:MAG TPA: hypothetical protein ENN76_02420, partial [Euryarchaeota archaeon]|nr:hypothetical protein [Euryarchaeota archaeon]
MDRVEILKEYIEEGKNPKMEWQVQIHERCDDGGTLKFEHAPTQYISIGDSLTCNGSVLQVTEVVGKYCEVRGELPLG